MLSMPGNPLFLRISSALILMPLVLGAMVYGDLPFLVMVGMALGLAVGEWLRMARNIPVGAAYKFAGVFYLTLCFCAFAYIRLNYPDGAGLALALLLCVWGSDTAAYFTGKSIGGPKLAPHISPNKTWSGLMGGVAGSAAALVIYVLYVGPALTRWTGIDFSVMEQTSLAIVTFIGASITISGQIGDLIESYEKRRAGFKDSGSLIPGHGGLLDRIDSLLLASPVYLLTLKVFGL